MAVMDKNPDLFERKAVIQRFLTQIKVPEVNELMKDVPAPEKRDSANENVAMALGKPAFAYIEQDHLAHLQSHLDFAKDPIMGANPLMAPLFIPNAIEHIKQHLTMWYLNRMNGYVLKSSGTEIKDYEQPAITAKVDKLFAVAAQHVNMDTNEVFQGVMPVLQGMIQEMQKYKPQPQMTPEAQVLERTSMAETQRRAAKDQADIQLAQKKQQDDMAMKMEDLELRLAIAEGDQQTQKEIEAARLERDAAKLRLDEGKAALTFATKGGQYGYQ